jgi:AcrR family transcriptional regulator
VSDQEVPEEEAGLGLPRLPPGRHGLDREYVVQNQRDRLTAAVIAVVAEVGYHAATVSKVCAVAGVSRRTFYSYYSSKQDCYLQAFDLIVEHLRAAVEEAGEGESDWPARVAARLSAMLEMFAANPDLVRFAVIAPLRAGEEIAAHHHEAVEGIRLALAANGGKIPGPSPAIEEALTGGIMSLIAAKVEQGEGENLPRLLPDLVEVFLTPYIGRGEAHQAAEAVQ